MSLVSAASSLWNLYVKHLWKYQSGSWVDSTASTLRVLAFLSILPFVILTLLDVTSYVIARTLGVIDDTKASTSETGSDTGTPAIIVQPESPPSTQTNMTTPPPTYFNGPMEEEGNLQLSGVGMFSPAPSQPPSPTISRRELSSHMHNISEERLDEGASVDPGRPPSRRSSSGESSFAMLDQESGAEDMSVMLRRRARPWDNVISARS